MRTIEYLQPNEIDDIRNQLKAMLKLSKQEYQIKDREHFQQACEKLYKVMIHVLEIKSGYNIRIHEQITDEFFWKKAKYQQSTMIQVTKDMNFLHYYFYEGGVYPNTIVEKTYLGLLKYIESIVDRL